MKKAILIYDPRTRKLIQVCDVRELTTEKFETFDKEAKENIRNIIAIEKKKAKEEKEKRDLEIESLDKRIINLTSVVSHLLGYIELDEETIESTLGIKKEENPDESEN